MTEALRIDLADGVLTATLNRPEVHNAVDAAILAGLTAAMDRAEGDAEVRILCLRGRGRTFCGGIDLKSVGEVARSGAAAGQQDATTLTGALLRLSRLGCPTMALMEGPAYGAGVGLIGACDIVFATPESHLTLSQVRHGLVPGFVAPFLAHAVGARRIRRYLLTGERIDADAALLMGLVHELVPADRIEDRAREICSQIALGGPESLAGTKRLIDRYGPPPLDDAAAKALAQEVARHRAGAEAAEGTAAFREKRPPAWCAG